MRSLATIGITALFGCAHLPSIKTDAARTYFVTESLCDGEKIVDYKRAEMLRQKYPNSTLVVLAANGAAEIEEHYHGKSQMVSGFYDGKVIDGTKLTKMVENIVPKGSLVFLMSHGDPKLNTPNMEVCPWNGWGEVRHISPEEIDRRIQQQGAHLTAQQFPEREVYPLNCSAHQKYLMESELDAVVKDLLLEGLQKPFAGRVIRDAYIGERDFLEIK